MIYALYLTETLLYLSFSLLMGTFIMHLIPSTKRPSIHIHKGWLQFSIIGIMLFSLMPVLYLIFMLFNDTGISLRVQDVFLSFRVGKAWIITFIISVFFYLFVTFFPVLKNKRYSFISVIFLVLLIFTIGWASHPASLNESTGFIYHSIHFTAVSVWVGTLLIVSWFSKNQENWLAFLKWFTPTAIICLGLTILSGFLIMSLIVDAKDYANSWMLNYGQALLIKHVIIVPILIFAYINGFWIKKHLQKGSNFNPKPWTKAESILLLLIFTATAVLGQQEPPKEIETTVNGSGVSPLFQYIYGGTLPPSLPVQFELNFMNISLFGISAIFFILVLWSYIKKVPAASLFLSLFLVISIYLSLMFSIQ
ncbi:copper resistance D family protein [Peribacillus sp. FSL M8-0224]|uniref:copper resistance D family protein n=1 Tax=Peribacillus sp. FSL M8-0224 TaxID=2921568 RepID=UPI0030F773DB|nr:CopD family protein [Brevibacterium sp. PAMC21349]